MARSTATDQRIVGRRREDRVAQRKIDHLHVERGAVGDDELDRANHVARLPGAGLVEHFQHDEVDRGSDALELAVRQRPGAADQSGDVRAVSEVIVRMRRLAAVAAREVVERGDAPVEVVARRDAGVDDRDADAAPGRDRRLGPGIVRQAQRIAQRADQRLRRARRVGLAEPQPAAAARLDVGVRGNRLDAPVGGERVDVAAVDFCGDGVDRRELAADDVAMLAQPITDGRRGNPD